MILKRKRWIFIASAIAFSILFCLILPKILSNSMNIVLFGTNGESFFPLSIQSVMWVLFFACLGDLAFRWYSMRIERNSLSQGFLPDKAEDERRVLTVDDMPDIYRSVKAVPTELGELIRNLALRFQAGKSVEQTHGLLSSQLELWHYRLDLDYSIVRYISWLIPTLGFIGTVVGISAALNFAGSGDIDPKSDEFLPLVTSELGLAFNTTLLSLVMSAIIVFITHWVQEKEERTVEATGRYCLDNLITRLYVQK